MSGNFDKLESGLLVPSSGAAGAIGHGAVFGAINQELERMKVEMGEVTILGRIRSLIPNPRAEWSGAWSVQDRIDNGEISESDVDTLFENIEHDYYATTPGSLIRCIDERPDRDYDDSKFQEYMDSLGPQIPGGTIDGALIFRQTIGENLEDFLQADMEEDMKTYATNNQATGYLAACHDDTLAVLDNPDSIGCAAVAKGKEAREKVNPNNIITLKGITESVLGPDFRDSYFNRFICNTTYMLTASQTYFKTIAEQKAILRSLNPKGLPVLSGPHNGLGLMINDVPNTSLHKELVSSRSDGKAQMFNYDLWYSREVAKKLLPYSKEAQSRYVHSRLAQAVATFMCISKDGSHTVGFRKVGGQAEKIAI